MSETARSSGRFRVIGSSPVRPDGVDKVTGKALYGADLSAPGMVWGEILRSPHAHARIRGIDTRRAAALEGVLAVVTHADLADAASAELAAGESALDLRDLARNVLAADKVLYHGHAVAAVAALTPQRAREALALIEVDYEPLPVVLDLDAAQAPDAPLLHEDLFTSGYAQRPQRPSNVAARKLLERGDLEAGFAAADVVVERCYTAPSAHQGYIEPHACLAEANRDGELRIWCCTQGQFAVRSFVAALLGIDVSRIRVTPSEIGGGFGGKTTVYLEPVAAALARKCFRPVKMVMSREDVFRATGPASATRVRVRIGARRDGRFTAMEARLEYEAGAFKGSPMGAAAMTVFAPYDTPNQRVEGFDVVVNKPKVAAYRAPGAPQAALATECVINELAEILDIDPIELRLHNAVGEGSEALYGVRFRQHGLRECLERAAAHPHYRTPLAAGCGRGVAVGFWFNIGLSSSAQVHLTETGRVIVDEGNPDIGGSRASMAMMAAETLGIPYEHITPRVLDTDSIGFSDLTGGSRTTFATGAVVVRACEDLIGQLRERAARTWRTEPGRVTWQDGAACHEDGRRLTLRELAAQAERTGGPLTGRCSATVKGAAPGFAVNLVDLRVDQETGQTTIERFTAIQDAGRAIHRAFVEGQMQGGAVQGIGWALNEEYVFDAAGVLQNPGFLDYRIPVASDLPMIDTEIVEVPNPDHPYGVRGVGETPICAPLAAVTTAVNQAAGTRITDLPLSPARVWTAIEAGRAPGSL